MVSIAIATNLLAVGPIAAAAKFAFDAYRLFETRDEILALVYGSHHDLWVKMGRPTGWQWKPKGERRNFFSGNLGGDQLGLWYYDPADNNWLNQAPEIIGLFKYQALLSRKLFRQDLPIVFLSFAFFVAYLIHLDAGAHF